MYRYHQHARYLVSDKSYQVPGTGVRTMYSWLCSVYTQCNFMAYSLYVLYENNSYNCSTAMDHGHTVTAAVPPSG